MAVVDTRPNDTQFATIQTVAGTGDDRDLDVGDRRNRTGDILDSNNNIKQVGDDILVMDDKPGRIIGHARGRGYILVGWMETVDAGTPQSTYGTFPQRSLRITAAAALGGGR